MSPQEQVLALLKTGQPIRSREFVQLGCGWDHRKIISRLRKKHHILSEIMPGDKEATYRLLVNPSVQERLL